jgi:hypothetical protein
VRLSTDSPWRTIVSMSDIARKAKKQEAELYEFTFQ